MSLAGRPRDERVRVHVRLRPPKGDDEVAASKLFELREKGTVDFTRSPGEAVKSFAFDSFFGPATSQERVYKEVASGIVDRVLNGYNGTIFAYGQTGTGKSHTMMGDEVEGPGRGVVPRALEHIFEEAEKDTEHDYSVTVSYVQLYCELLQDLLEPELNKSLSIRETPEKGVYVEGASTFTVTSKEDCLHYLRVGEESRVVACTNMNATSSRSHAAFLVNVEKRPRLDGLQAVNLEEKFSSSSPKVFYGKLFIVDLAGSERVKSSGAAGLRFSELKAINLSLTALGNCISSLSLKKKHVPFRDSKLTRLLQNSLGGNAKTALVINVGPAAANSGETYSSLLFGQRAMSVETRVRQNVDVDYKALYTAIQAQLDQKDDEINRLQISKSQQQQEVEEMRRKLEEEGIARQRAEAEASSAKASYGATIDAMQAIKDGGEGGKEVEAAEGKDSDAGTFLTQAAEDDDERAMDSTIAVIQEMTVRQKREMDTLKKEFEAQLEQLRSRQKTGLTAEKGRADQATEEWNTIEYELKDEREDHLRTCIALRECRQQITQLDADLSSRVSELVEENSEFRSRVKELEDTRRSVSAMESQLKAVSGSEAAARENYLEKAQALEQIYGEKMEMLISRVEELETADGERRRRNSEEGAKRQQRSSFNRERAGLRGPQAARANREKQEQHQYQEQEEGQLQPARGGVGGGARGWGGAAASPVSLTTTGMVCSRFSVSVCSLLGQGRRPREPGPRGEGRGGKRGLCVQEVVGGYGDRREAGPHGCREGWIAASVQVAGWPVQQGWKQKSKMLFSEVT